MVVYVKQQGAVVGKRGGRITVEKDDKLLAEIPLRETDCVAVFGNVQVTTQAISELLERGIPLALYTRHGRLKGRLAPEVSKQVLLRLAQYKGTQDEAAALRLARALVRAKLRNAVALIQDYRSNYPSQELEAASGRIKELSQKAERCASHEELLGVEGAAAAAYFGAFAGMNRSGLPFEGRRKRPATDPINGLLSLGYTMVMNELRSLAEGIGLEPHLGYLHKADYGRPSLALDLLEPFRPALVDRLTLKLVNARTFTGEDFARRVTGPLAGGVVLKPEAFERCLENYEEAMTEARRWAPDGMRAALRLEVEKLARAIRDGADFAPYMEED